MFLFPIQAETRIAIVSEEFDSTLHSVRTGWLYCRVRQLTANAPGIGVSILTNTCRVQDLLSKWSDNRVRLSVRVEILLVFLVTDRSGVTIAQAVGQSQAVCYGGPGSDPRRFMWDFWWTNGTGTGKISLHFAFSCQSYSANPVHIGIFLRITTNFQHF